ncbi:MAG: SDR family oxidoreductase [Lachnospiraceae bacterium]|nr:SDR family oxidoreductase [Lachnospiraceae bacterium]
MQTLEQRTCVFAGASGGDGVAAVKALCKGGMNVVMMTHQPAQAQELIKEMEKLEYPGKCEAMQDGKCQNPPISDAEVYRQIFEKYGSIDVVICNTGGDGFEDSIDSVDTELMMKEVGHLLGGSYSMLKCALPYLRQSRAPRVIFMTTVEGVRGGRLESFTNAVAKGAVAALGKNCAARLASEGITVNCIEKGAIERLPHNGADHGPKFKDISGMLPLIPAGRMGTPEDLAQAICFLASEESSYVSGTVLDVSGGLSLV